MASLLHKLLRKSQPLALQTLSFLSKSQPRTALLRTPILSINPDLFLKPSPGHISCFLDNDAAEKAFFRFYPSFPYFLNLEPFSQRPNVQSDAEPDYASEGDGRTVWADSVKKKRKRKMNKHKYRKLRKRLRRQT